MRNAAVHAAAGVLRLMWQLVCLPMLALLLVLEPVVRIVLSMLALLSLLTAFLFEFSAVVPNFPFWWMIGFTVACALTRLAYEVAIHMLAK